MYRVDVDSREHGLVRLADEFGGEFWISRDDGCLTLSAIVDGERRLATHWFHEAVSAIDLARARAAVLDEEQRLIDCCRAWSTERGHEGHLVSASE